jgi:hypothetical protein
MRKRIRQIVLVVICVMVIGWTGFAIGQAAAVKEKAASKESVVTPAGQSQGFYDRIMHILKDPPKLEYPPHQPVVENQETPILGSPEVTREQIVLFVRQYNPDPRLSCSLEEIVGLYYEEAELEGIRPDIAFSQALLETGFFRYGGDVLPEQNNFAGIGTTGRGTRGIWFETPRLGVRAHIQHLLAYTNSHEPTQPIIDPRYYIARNVHFSQCSSWESLSGKWAVPGINYGQNILKILERIKNI